MTAVQQASSGPSSTGIVAARAPCRTSNVAGRTAPNLRRHQPPGRRQVDTSPRPLLHAHAISEAGAILGKAGRRSTVSDWMYMEKARGISISPRAALQFAYRDESSSTSSTPLGTRISPRTPTGCSGRRQRGHAHRRGQGPRTADDEAVRRVQAARRADHHGHQQVGPPGLDPLALLDEIHARTGLTPTPLTWPVGICGRLPRRSRSAHRHLRSLHPHRRWGDDRRSGAPDASSGPGSRGRGWTVALEEHDLLTLDDANHDSGILPGGPRHRSCSPQRC